MLRETAGIHRTNGGTLRRVFRCACSCGNETRATLQALQSGETRSCGWLRRKDRTGPAARARWREYHAERRQRQRSVIDEFQAVLRGFMAEKALPERVLRPRFAHAPKLFNEVFVKRRLVPTEAEARDIALAMNWRGRAASAVSRRQIRGAESSSRLRLRTRPGRQLIRLDHQATHRARRKILPRSSLRGPHPA